MSSAELVRYSVARYTAQKYMSLDEQVVADARLLEIEDGVESD